MQLYPARVPNVPHFELDDVLPRLLGHCGTSPQMWLSMHPRHTGNSWRVFFLASFTSYKVTISNYDRWNHSKGDDYDKSFCGNCWQKAHHVCLFENHCDIHCNINLATLWEPLKKPIKSKCHQNDIIVFPSKVTLNFYIVVGVDSNCWQTL